MIEALPSLYGSTVARDALHTEAEVGVEQALVMMRRARVLVAADRVHAIALLAARQAALAGHLGRYQRFKHAKIFDPVVAHGSASAKIVARTMKVDCMALGEVFGAFCTRWSTLTASDWPAYRADLLATVDLLDDHLRQELRAIRQLLMISALYAG